MASITSSDVNICSTHSNSLEDEDSKLHEILDESLQNSSDDESANQDWDDIQRELQNLSRITAELRSF
jgi:hypothetical protein